MEKKPYRTTALAGFFVAGQRVPSRQDDDGNRVPVIGHVLNLTDDEAKYELLSGSIEAAEAEAGAAPLSPPRKKSGKAA
ncbi:hypothetical protein [Bosea minatitlanensis]|uniref:Uncharacterized protein n=1 Tax=Bosea minatitlanensis TaxID=128782 RepID=A0ABW0F125_9HYPH|nr:hypothetical protein [Bosea minatitlanensis]MCT4491808.1 hypothetical protein [Bosea minatitlanensis]